MHKIDKFLARLTSEQREKILAIVEQIHRGDFNGLNLKKLKNAGLLYRVRVGKCRIIFEMDTSSIRILSIDFRKEDTYKHL